MATDVSSGSEDFKFEWLLMAGGSAATERMTLDSLGNLAIDGDLTMGDDLKLSANANDYATLSVADTGDLTIATTGDGTTDSDIILDSDGDIFRRCRCRYKVSSRRNFLFRMGCYRSFNYEISY